MSPAYDTPDEPGWMMRSGPRDSSATGAHFQALQVGGDRDQAGIDRQPVEHAVVEHQGGDA